ncbi:MAG: hypothetical protein DRJ51_09415, partial [Thermoprotei archaeon]
WYRYPGGNKYVIKGVTFSFKKGILSIAGPNGSGKTTLLKLISGLLKPVKGSVIIEEKNLWSLDEKTRTAIRREIIYVHEKPVLFKGTVMENVSYPLKLRGSGKGERLARAIEALKLLGIEDIAHEKTRNLSAGQAQLVSIARALAVKPKYLLLDEPTSNLDAKREEALLKLLRDIAQKGTVLLVASHEKRILRIADRALLLKDGCAAFYGDPNRAQQVLREIYKMTPESPLF